MEENMPDESRYPDRWTLIRDVAVLQVKLIVDGLRDLILVPTSLIAGVASLLGGEGRHPGPQFYRLLGYGKQSEHWINLFGAYRHSPEDVVREQGFSDVNIDDIVGRVESFVVDEYRRGGVTAQAKARIDRALNAIQRRHKPSQ
jgi:hypothetical protein